MAIKGKGYSFAEKHVSSMSLTDFLKANEHQKHLPLKEIWNRAQPKKKKQCNNINTEIPNLIVRDFLVLGYEKTTNIYLWTVTFGFVFNFIS